LENADIALTLYLRRASRLKNPDPGRVEIVSAPSRDLLYAGGNIHRITQQEPVAGFGT
jgi:agmatine/peptidylarginine deiminase